MMWYITILNVLISGLLTGCMVALMALGLNVIYGVARVLNTAHAELVILAAFVAYWAYKIYNIDPFISMFLVMPLFFTIGVIMQRFFVAPFTHLKERELFALSMVLFFGLGSALKSGMSLAWSNDARLIQPPYAGSVNLGGFLLPITRGLCAVVSIVSVIVLYIFLTRTKIGKGIRALSQNRKVAEILGVNTKRLSALVFGIAAAAAAVSGTLIGLVFVFVPMHGRMWLGRLFTVIILGGLGSVPGAFVASLLIGMMESTIAYLYPLSHGQMVANAVTALILLLTLLFRPKGLMGIEA